MASVGDGQSGDARDPLAGGHNEKVAVSTVARPFRATRAAGYVGAFFAGGLALSALYATTGLGLVCPFRALTGWDCPLCGGTRMGAALLHGDVRRPLDSTRLRWWVWWSWAYLAHCGLLSRRRAGCSVAASARIPLASRKPDTVVIRRSPCRTDLHRRAKPALSETGRSAQSVICRRPNISDKVSVLLRIMVLGRTVSISSS